MKTMHSNSLDLNGIQLMSKVDVKVDDREGDFMK